MMERNTFSKLFVKSSAYVEWCFNDEDGYTREYFTLAEAKREAKKYSKEHPDFEVVVYPMGSSFTFLNGKEIE